MEDCQCKLKFACKWEVKLHRSYCFILFNRELLKIRKLKMVKVRKTATSTHSLTLIILGLAALGHAGYLAARVVNDYSEEEGGYLKNFTQ